MKICGLIPAYNEEGTAVGVIKDTLKYVDKVIFVNDGSQDKTLDVVKSNLSNDKRIKILSWDRNQGKGYALIQGFKKFLGSDCSILVTLDADGQHDPSQIPYMIAPLRNKSSDVVLGVRMPNPEYSKPRVFFNIVSSLAVLLAAGSFHTDVASGFKAYTKYAVKKILPHLKTKDFSIELEILKAQSMESLRSASIPISTMVGKKATFWKLARAYTNFAWKYRKDILKRVFRI
ncbi:MAG TPA: glycosyltransferase family 2 protein [archaeon]|nr:glycosyltransferase family 2 protein [archaeon]